MMVLLGYTDPGVGTLVWQILAASSIGLIFYFRKFFVWIKSVLKKNKNKTSE